MPSYTTDAFNVDLHVGFNEFGNDASNHDEPLEMDQLRSINSVSMNQGAVSNTPNSQTVPLILSQHSKRLNRVHSRGDAIQNGIDDGEIK